MAYEHRDIEKKAQEKWASLDLYRTDLSDDSKEPYYLLVEFPYPSGDLHIGHWYAFAVTDIYARMLRMRGKNVLFPIGFDAFGLPAENAAIKNGVDPKEWTYKNIERMKEQIASMGPSFDWSKEVVACDPGYYQWTQWLFAKLFEHGLAVHKEAPVKWCPKDQTVLANEQVIDGKCDRCGTEVVEKRLTQWFLKITDYAERLLEGLEKLPWREEIKDAQRAWIGKSEGAYLEFPISNASKPNFIILHGWTGRADKNFIPWLKAELENRGYGVQAPQMPDTDHPTENDQVAYVLENCRMDENTVLIGHSLGAIVAMKALIKHGKPIRELVLVAAAKDPKHSNENKNFHATFSWEFDFETLKKLAPDRLILSDLKEKDRIVYLEEMAANLDAKLVTGTSKREHYTGKEEPDILESLNVSISGRNEKIKVFTTRPDTVFGATYVVLAPEHPLIQKIEDRISNIDEVKRYVKETAQKTERERSENKDKTGVKLEGVSAVNPATKEEIPVYIADYVLASYGTGAVMAVPAHDERDFEFAQKMDLPVREVVDRADKPAPYTGEGLLLNSGDFTGKGSGDAKWDIVAYAGGTRATMYRLRDWLVSRQRYWGCPIPIVYDPEGKPHVIPSEHLPWLLPTDVDFTPTGKAPLASSNELRERVTKIFGEGWTPEYDTLDTFVDSSWYFLRYLDSQDAHDFSDAALMKKWMPVNRYSGGAEHTTLHLLYSRFFTKALYDLALVPVDEPYAERFNRGIILGPDGQKMSKSKGNVINPDEFVQKYGADAVRIYLAFIGPYNEAGSYPWSLDGVASMHKFLERVVRLAERSQDVSEVPETMRQALAKASAKVAEDGDRFKFNTAVAALMILMNELESAATVPNSVCREIAVMLAPFAPHLAEHLWEQLGGEGSVHQQAWPKAEIAVETEKEVVVQVNGKRRGSVGLAVDAEESAAVALALEVPAVANALGGNAPKRVIYVPGKILNLVV